ncbi:MAG: hypothetical protein AAGJ35_04055 [Myxococcota bacterium]
MELMMEELRQTLPPVIQKALAKEAPLPMKKMAASGRLPMSPVQQITTLYFLSLEPAEEVSKVAQESLLEIPEKSIEALILKEDAMDILLGFVAPAVLSSENLTQALLLHRNTPDTTVAWLARQVEGVPLEIIARNQQRQLRFPQIVTSLLENPKTPEPLRVRVIELALREGLDIGFQQAELEKLLGEAAAEELLEVQQQKLASRPLSDEEKEALTELQNDPSLEFGKDAASRFTFDEIEPQRSQMNLSKTMWKLKKRRM